jgi:hypothetical protein
LNAIIPNYDGKDFLQDEIEGTLLLPVEKVKQAEHFTVATALIVGRHFLARTNFSPDD